MARACANCGRILGGRADKVFCSSACRVAAFRDRPPRGELVRLVDAVADNREARLEAVLLAAVSRAAEDDWRASAWILERRYPDRWGKADRDDGGADLLDVDLAE